MLSYCKFDLKEYVKGCKLHWFTLSRFVTLLIEFIFFGCKCCSITPIDHLTSLVAILLQSIYVNQIELYAFAPSMAMLCSCEIAANSLSHSSSTTAHIATSRVRSLVAPKRDCDELVDVNEDMSSRDVGWLSEYVGFWVGAILVAVAFWLLFPVFGCVWKIFNWVVLISWAMHEKHQVN